MTWREQVADGAALRARRIVVQVPAGVTVFSPSGAIAYPAPGTYQVDVFPGAETTLRFVAYADELPSHIAESMQDPEYAAAAEALGGPPARRRPR